MDISILFPNNTKETITNTLLKKEFTYMDNEGIVRCKKCNAPLMFYMEEAKRWFPCSCNCADISNKKIMQLSIIKKLKEEAGIPERYSQMTFENYEVDEKNRIVYNSCKNFAQKYDIVCKNGNGLYLYGDINTARILVSCIANCIINQGREVYFRKLNDILSEIQQSYIKKSTNNIEPMEKYSSVGLLIIDNIGMEDYQKYGRDTNFVQDKVNMLIDNRFVNKKPTIFTSCFDFNSLIEKRGMNEITVQTIIDLSTRCFEVKPKNEKLKLERFI